MISKINVIICYSKLLLIILSMVSLAVSPGETKAASGIVDIEKILIESNAAHLGREHLKQASVNLEKGYLALQQELSKLPEAQRQKEMQDAARALNQQLELEKAAVNRVITQMMMEEIRSFRIANKIDVVLPKQVILDADAGLDITNQIIKEMNTKKPVFGQLPTVQIKKSQPKPKAKKP